MSFLFRKKEELDFDPYFNVDDSYIELYRIYCVIASICIPSFTYILHTDDRFMGDLYLEISVPIYLLSLFVGSYFSEHLRKNIFYYFFWFVLGYTIYSCNNNFMSNYTTTDFIGFSLLFFGVSFALQKVKLSLIYSAVTIGVVLYYFNFVQIETEVKQEFVIPYLLIVSAISIFILLNRSISERRLEANAGFLSSIFENTFDAVFVIDVLKNNIVKYNSKARQLFGIKGYVNISSQKSYDFFTSRMENEEDENRFRALFESDEVNDEIFKFNHAQTGDLFIGKMCINSVEIKKKNYRIVRITDETMKFEVERKLKENNDRLFTILNNINHLVYRVSIDEEGNRKVEYISPQLEYIYNMDENRFADLLQTGGIYELIHEDDKEEVREIVHDLEEIKHPVSFEYRIKKQGVSDDKYVWLEEKIFPKVDADGNLIALFGITSNIDSLKTSEIQVKKERKRAERAEELNFRLAEEIRKHQNTQNKLLEQSSKIKALFDNTSNLMIWTVDANYILTSFNGNFEKTMRKYYKVNVCVGDNLKTVLRDSVKPEYYRYITTCCSRTLRGEPQRLEGPMIASDGEKFWIETYLNPIILKDNLIREYSCIAHDITDKKYNEGVLKDSLREKEVLLREVHHRVKNNMQVINSILSLQSSIVEDQNTLEILKESQNRIKSMAYIHESLYQTKNFSSINFLEYIDNLLSNLLHSYHIYDGQVTLEKYIDDVNLSLDQAIPCGLILNELVSNAFKYAYKDMEIGEGKLQVFLSEKNNQVSIEVKDNGIGLPENFEIENSPTLGLQLVTTLSDQLDANLSVKVDNGTKFLITFERQI